MDVPDYVEQLRRDGERLATVVSFTDPGAPVPTLKGTETLDSGSRDQFVLMDEA